MFIDPKKQKQFRRMIGEMVGQLPADHMDTNQCIHVATVRVDRRTKEEVSFYLTKKKKQLIIRENERIWMTRKYFRSTQACLKWLDLGRFMFNPNK